MVGPRMIGSKNDWSSWVCVCVCGAAQHFTPHGDPAMVEQPGFSNVTCSYPTSMLILLHVGSPRWAVGRWVESQEQPNPGVWVEAELSIWAWRPARLEGTSWVENGTECGQEGKEQAQWERGLGPGGEGTVRWAFQNNGTYCDVLEVRQVHAHTVHEGARRREVRPLGV